MRAFGGLSVKRRKGRPIVQTQTGRERSRFLAPVLGSFLALAAAFLVFSGRGYAEEQAVSLTKADVEAAARQRVLFAHQSVGANIFDGVRKLADENNVKLTITESRSDQGKTPAIFQFMVGQNGDPLGKIKDFVSTSSSFPDIDVAMVKICYVDLNKSSDATAVAKTYADAIKALQRARPSTRFIAITSPLTAVPTGAKAWLTAVPTGAKAWVKSLIMGSSPELADNEKRKKFNDYLRKEFDKDHLFDLAALEAEKAVADDGKEIEVMRPSLTSDGGHLNAAGQRLIGAAFIKFLAAQKPDQHAGN
jgi:lysophospholipase L1-like esterase